MNTFLDRTYRGLRFFTDRILAYAVSIVVLGSVILALVEIVRRYLFGMVFHWGQDAVTYFILGSVFLFFVVTQARRSHLAVTAMLDIFKRRGQMQVVRWMRVLNSAIALSFYSAFAWWGYPAVERMYMMGRTTQSMLLVLWPFQACLLVSFSLMALVALFQLYQDIQAVRGIKVFPWAETEEGIDI